jgi:hypothetical protein
VACDFACIDSALLRRYADNLAGAAALVRDRGSQFTSSFDEIFRSEGMKVLQTPVRTPRHRLHRPLQRSPDAAAGHQINPLRRTHQRIPKRSMTSHDTISGTHRIVADL